MSNFSIIIPIHKFNESVSDTLAHAVASVINMNGDCEIVVVGPQDVIDSVKKNIASMPITISYIANEESDYCTQVNVAVSKIKSPYFSVLEFDDRFNPTWIKNVEEYIAYHHDTIAAYLPLTELKDFKETDSLNSNFLGFVNEVGWARGFTDEELGFITHDALMVYYDYNTSGAIFKTDVFLKLGGLKSAIKLFFWYEYLLRLTNNQEKIFVIPKVGYQHYINVDGSMTKAYEEELNQEDAEQWLKTAQDESYTRKECKTTRSKGASCED